MEVTISPDFNEDADSYRLRVSFIEKVLTLPPGNALGQMDVPTAELLSRMFVKKLRFGVTYDENTEAILAYLRDM